MIVDTYAPKTGTSFGLRAVIKGLSVALLTLILVPAAALSLSYLAGGAATSTILFVYLFALLTNGAFLMAALALLAGALFLPRVFAHRTHHYGHA
jgi:hypothetical protein